MNKTRTTIMLIILIAASFLSAEDEVEREGNLIKIRTSGICFLDPGISDDQAKLISKYDAINESLFKLGVYLEKNDSLLNEKISKNDVIKYLCNYLNVSVYKDGEENIDGYPAYVSYISAEIHISFLNSFLLQSKIDNQFRYQLLSEYERFKGIVLNIGSMKEATNKLPDNFINELSSSLIASDWANKAHLIEEEGLKLEYYSISIDNDKLYESSYIYLSDVLIRVGKQSDVLGILNKLINYNPLKYPAAYSKRGEVYTLQKLYSNAIKELEKAIAIDPYYADAYCILGSVYSALKKDDEAIIKFKQAVEIDENFYKPYFMRANYYRKNGKYDEALKDYEKTILLNPKNTDSYFNKGLTYYLTGNYHKAVEEYTKAIYLDELSPTLYYNRGIAYRKLSDMQNATEDYKTYLLLTVKDINKESYNELIKTWIADDKFRPMFQD